MYVSSLKMDGKTCMLQLQLRQARMQRVCLNVAGRDSRVEVACAGVGKGRGCGCGLGSRVNINHQI